MTLTEKQKRFIISPHSFSSIQQKMWRQIIRKKISHITADYTFISEHKDEISHILGENIQISDDIIEHAEHSEPNNSKKDPDFL